jgi:hypothetical protein
MTIASRTTQWLARSGMEIGMEFRHDNQPIKEHVASGNSWNKVIFDEA